MDLEKVKIIFRNLFRFRLHNLELLMNMHYYEEISSIYPSIILTEGEFPSYKFNILKYLSWNGCELIQNPYFYGLEDDIFPYLRYKKISGWDKFWKLSHYTGEFYTLIKQYGILCKKIIFTKDFEELTSLRDDLFQLYTKLDIGFKNGMQKNSKQVFNFFFYHDVHEKDYSMSIFCNLLKEEEFRQHFLNDSGDLFPVGGFYKAIFGLFQGYFKVPLSNEEIEAFLEQINPLEYRTNSFLNEKKFEANSLWKRINSIRHKLGEYGDENQEIEAFLEQINPLEYRMNSFLNEKKFEANWPWKFINSIRHKIGEYGDANHYLD